MPQYFFHIRQDGYSSDHAEGLEFPDKEAARTEAAAVCSDMMRGIVGQTASRPEWRLDVTQPRRQGPRHEPAGGIERAFPPARGDRRPAVHAASARTAGR